MDPEVPELTAMGEESVMGLAFFMGGFDPVLHGGIVPGWIEGSSRMITRGDHSQGCFRTFTIPD